jgi:hypothetical protein
MLGGVPCTQPGCGAYIRSGFGLAPVVDALPVEQGPWERDRVVTERELSFAWFLWGITCLRVRVLTGLT